MLKLVSVFDIDYDMIIAYRLSFVQNYNELSFSLYNARYGNKIDYYNFLMRTGNKHVYFLIDDSNPNYILGNCVFNTRFDYHDEHCNRGSIGYSIRPNERNKHYGTYILSLMLKKCQESGIKEVCVSCLKNNISSKKIIENNGGKLEKEFYDVWGHDTGLKYWIDLDNENQIK